MAIEIVDLPLIAWWFSIFFWCFLYVYQRVYGFMVFVLVNSNNWLDMMWLIYILNWLLVWNHGILWLSIQLGIIIPTDFHSIIFQRGRLKPPTRNWQSRICTEKNSETRPKLFSRSEKGNSYHSYPKYQWEFQDPKMEVLYHIRPYFVGIFPYIGLKYRPYIW